ncbi:MAG: type II secretion system protein [Armatimonadetes bacterium]|nr:type II secretion system protein [Armatimonadota bacterium]
MSRGFTLIEMMVAMAVLGLCLTGALTLFLPSLDRFAVADTSYDAQRHALAAVRQIATDLERTRTALFLVSQRSPGSLNAVSIPTALDATGVLHTTGDGTPMWQGWVQYWLVSETPPAVGSRLFRAFAPGSPDMSGATPPAHGNGRMVAGGIANVKIEVGLSGTLDADPSSGASDVLGVIGGVEVYYSPRMTPAGSGRMSVQVLTLRLLHDRRTTFEGRRTVDVLFQ